VNGLGIRDMVFSQPRLAVERHLEPWGRGRHQETGDLGCAEQRRRADMRRRAARAWQGVVASSRAGLEADVTHPELVGRELRNRVLDDVRRLAAEGGYGGVRRRVRDALWGVVADQVFQAKFGVEEQVTTPTNEFVGF